MATSWQTNRNINKYALYIINANKSYGRNEILNNFCMKVPRGCIYGLLGASGCGKTTLLNCVLGIKELNSGDIFVLGGKPRTVGSGVPGPRVGYMPQETALVAEFTVNDAIFFFGRILNMKDDLIKERYQVLKQLLDLPPDGRQLKNCSGGQQRRVSLAAALIHKPELLILDEPTVGLDPVLSASIWGYLLQIAEEERTAIIVTTHYIEEAKRAHKVGIMRGGKLLVEESPDSLLHMFNTDSLEEVFYILSKRQDAGRLNSDVETPTDGQYNAIETVNGDLLASLKAANERKFPRTTTTLNVKKHHLKALFSKNFKQLTGNYGNGLILAFILPIMEILCFVFAIGGEPKNIPIAVVNHEKYNNCMDYNKHETAVPYSTNNCKFANLSCRFMDDVQDPLFKFVSYNSLNNAFDDAQHGKVTGVIFMAQNFSNSFSNRINNIRHTSEKDFDLGEVKVWLDESSQIGSIVRVRIYKLFQNFLISAFEDCHYLGQLGEFPMRFHFEYGIENESYANFLIPGALVSIVFYLGTILSCTAIVTDQTEGIWDRSIVAGISSMEIYIAHFVTQLSLVFMQTLELIVLTLEICRIENSGQLWIIFLLVSAQGICGMVFGLLASIIAQDHYTASFIITGIFLPMVCVGGLIWPLEAQPDSLRYISLSLPFTIPNNSLRQVLKKGYGLDSFQVLNGLSIPVIWCAILAILSVLAIRMKR